MEDANGGQYVLGADSWLGTINSSVLMNNERQTIFMCQLIKVIPAFFVRLRIEQCKAFRTEGRVRDGSTEWFD